MKNYNQIKNILNLNDFNNRMIEEYGNIKIKESELNEFNELSKNYLSVLINENENLPSTFNIKVIKDKIETLESKVETLESKVDKLKTFKEKIKNFKVRLNKKDQGFFEEKKEVNKKIAINKNFKISDVVKEIERDYDIILTGHESNVNIIAILDKKYILSGSRDSTIRM